jgi:hypothetical protein
VRSDGPAGSSRLRLRLLGGAEQKSELPRGRAHPLAVPVCEMCAVRSRAAVQMMTVKASLMRASLRALRDDQRAPTCRPRRVSPTATAACWQQDLIAPRVFARTRRWSLGRVRVDSPPTSGGRLRAVATGVCSSPSRIHRPAWHRCPVTAVPPSRCMAASVAPSRACV